MDEPEFETFYRATADRLRVYLYRVCRERRIVDDLLQEAYYRFLRSKFAGGNEEDRVRYLFRIATNLLKDHWAEARRSGTLAVEMPEHPEGEAPAIRLDVHSALGALKATDREMLWLAYAEGCSARGDRRDPGGEDGERARPALPGPRASAGAASPGRLERIFIMKDDELIELFRRSRDEERWPEPLPAPAAIWWRARAADLLAGEICQRERKIRPLAVARGLAGLAALVAAELGVLEGFFKMPEELGKAMTAAGLSPWTATLLIIAAVPTATLILRLRREAPGV